MFGKKSVKTGFVKCSNFLTPSTPQRRGVATSGVGVL